MTHGKIIRGQGWHAIPGTGISKTQGQMQQTGYSADTGHTRQPDAAPGQQPQSGNTGTFSNSDTARQQRTRAEDSSSDVTQPRTGSNFNMPPSQTPQRPSIAGEQQYIKNELQDSIGEFVQILATFGEILREFRGVITDVGPDHVILVDDLVGVRNTIPLLYVNYISRPISTRSTDD